MPIEIVSCAFFALIIYIDVIWHKIPDKLTLPGMLVGFILNSGFDGFQGALFSMEGILSGGCSIFLSGCIAILIWGKAGIGGGDLKLVAMIGAFFGPIVALITYAIYPFFASIYAFIFEKKKIPCAPFIIASCLIALKLKGLYAP